LVIDTSAHQLGGAAQDMLAVVQHQQRRAGTEDGRDAGDDAGGDGARADRGASGPSGAQGGRDLAGHVVVGGDAGERDEVHDPLLRLVAHHLGEAGLAEAAGPDDRGDPDRAQQVRHRGDVVVAAEQRVGLVGHPVADDGRGALEQLLVDGLEGGTGVAAELVAQRAAVGLVAVQRRRRTQRRRLAAQQLGQHLLVPRTLADQPGELVGRFGVATQP
jgi:hypothetical protein